MIGIYKITSPSGKVYIGQSRNIRKRFLEYKRLDCKGQIKIYRSIMKHGFENHVFETVEECEASELNNRERYYQELFCVIGPNGLNLQLTKTDILPYKHSEETKIKIGNAHRGKKVSKEAIEKSRMSNLGKIISVETRLKLSVINTGKILSQDHKDKIGLSNKGRKPSERALINSRLATKDRKHSDEDRLKISLNNPRTKVVLNTQTGVFYTTRELDTMYNKYSGYFTRILRGERKNNTYYKQV